MSANDTTENIDILNVNNGEENNENSMFHFFPYDPGNDFRNNNNSNLIK